MTKPSLPNDPNHDPTLDVLDEKLAQLDTSVLPERDLWPAISAEINAESEASTSTWRVMSIAATVVLGLVASVLLLKTDQDAANEAPAVARDTTSPVEAPPFAFDLPTVQLTSYPGDAYSDAREDELAELESRIQSLPPEQRAIVETNLATIREALADIDAALLDDPESTALKELLVKTYQRELETINKVSRIADSVRVDL
ncbi:MAG: hypothetical protein AAGH76_15885 [Pseudomonadota bacterium]